MTKCEDKEGLPSNGVKKEEEYAALVEIRVKDLPHTYHSADQMLQQQIHYNNHFQEAKLPKENFDANSNATLDGGPSPRYLIPNSPREGPPPSTPSRQSNKKGFKKLSKKSSKKKTQKSISSIQGSRGCGSKPPAQENRAPVIIINYVTLTSKLESITEII